MDSVVTDYLDEHGLPRRRFELAGLAVTIAPLDASGDGWEVRVGADAGGSFRFFGTLEEATWEAIRRTRELSEGGAGEDRERPGAEAPSSSQPTG